VADEVFDLVDAEGRVIGHASRAQCHADPSLLHQAVHLFVFHPDGRLFLQKRSMTKRIQPGRWDTSVGGHVGLGEPAHRALLREAREELGLQRIEPDFLHSYIWRSEVESELVRTYRCTHRGPFELQSDEIDEGRFFTLPEVRALVGTGQLTPNLEHELGLLGILDPPGARTAAQR